MRVIEKPDRIDLRIGNAIRDAKRRKRRIPRVDLNPTESRIFWEDLIEQGAVTGDPDSDADFEAFVALGDYDFFGTTVRLNIDGV